MEKILFFSIVEMLLSALGIAAFVFLLSRGEPMGRWVLALINSAVHVYCGYSGIQLYKELRDMEKEQKEHGEH